MFSVCESFMVFWNNKFHDHCYSIYNVDTGSMFEKIATSKQPFYSFLYEKMFNFISNKRR